MTSPISQRAVDFVRSRATSVMTYTCQIERFSAPPSHDPDTLITPARTSTVIYSGVCRLWEVSGGTVVLPDDPNLVIQTTNLSIPWDVAVVPKRFDEVVILTSLTDPAVVGKRFQIQDSAKAGEMRATRRFTVIAVERVS